MSIFKEYVRGDIRKNKKKYNSSIITIFLAVLILSSFVFGVLSYYKSYRDLIKDATAGYHFRLVNELSNEDAKKLVDNRNIKKIGFFNIKEIDQALGSKSKTHLIKMDPNSIDVVESLLKEGEMPGLGEIMISNDMVLEIDKGLGDNLEIDGRNYRISGIYYDTSYQFEDYYNIFLNVKQENLLESGEGLSPFIWYKNIFKTYSISEKIMGDLDPDGLIYNFNKLYLDRSFVFDPEDDLIKDHSFQIMLILLFVILIVLFYSIIVNLFLVQESKSIVEYSKLKAIGAKDKDISRIVSLKATYISQLPIILGILSSLGLVKILFFIINKVNDYFASSKEAFTSNMELGLVFDIKILAFLYIISFLIIYMATRKPIRKLKKNSILDGLKGNIKNKNYKKYDLIYKGNIEKDLSKQFYKNSRRNFRFTAVTLQLGFLLMSFIIAAIGYYNLESIDNRADKYRTYGIQAEFASASPLNKEFFTRVQQMELDGLINFRKEYVYLDFDENDLDEDYRDSGLLKNLEEEAYSLENLKVTIFGVDDTSFNRILLEKGMNPDNFKGNKVLLLNTIGDDFRQPISKIETVRLFKDDLKEISLSEYGDLLDTRGYEFSLDVEDKIYEALFDYNIRKDHINVYMAKSEYIKLFNKFERIADLDQFEYLSIASNNIEEDQAIIDRMAGEYFKESDYGVVSKLDEDRILKKRRIVANILSIFFSLFFMAVGFSNCYFSFYNLFLDRREELLLYKAIGMDRKLLNNILKTEKKKILSSFIISMPLIIVGIAFIMGRSSKAFGTLDIMMEINYISIISYILLIIISISKMYDKYKDQIV